MANKPSILQAQRLPFQSLFASCMLDASKKYLMAIGALGAIAAVMGLLTYFGPSAWSALVAAFWAVVGALQLGNVVRMLSMAIGVTADFVINIVSITTNGSYTLTKQLLPGVLEFTAIACRGVKEIVDGKEVITSICDGTATVHFPASGVWLGLVFGWVILALTVVVWLVCRVMALLKGTEWDVDEWRDMFWFVALALIPSVVAVVTLASVLTGVTHGLAMPVLKQAFNAPVEYQEAFLGSVALMLLVFVLPIVVLQSVMDTHVRKARAEAKYENRQLPVGYRLYRLNDKAEELLVEPWQMGVYRSVAVAFGAVAFLSIVQFGTTIWPSGLGAAVFAVIALGVVAITLACVVTCYPSLREGYQQLQKARDEAIAQYKAEKAAKAKKRTND
ncbi:MAG: hypothetical protein EBR79_01450 [Proteobacteria bacterium]|nr:hypothetical protein [Pseudomonadota bacterium]NBX86492.1 hypothetical protein [Pseudomonadota bacterium]